MASGGLPGQAGTDKAKRLSGGQRKQARKVIHRMWESGRGGRLNLLWVLQERLACIVKRAAIRP